MYTFNIKTWIDNGVEAIKYDHRIWISKTQFGNSIGHSNRASVIQYYSSKHKRQRNEIQDCDDYQPCRVFLEEELVMKILIDTRTTAVVKAKAKFGINQHHPILTKEQSICSKILKVFTEIIEQYFILNERIDFYLPKHKLAVEVDELGHLDRDEEDEIKRQ